MINYYAGIGARDTPAVKLGEMMHIARKLRLLDYVLRSGGAQGADSAFESMVGTRKQIFRPSDSGLVAQEHAAKYHPNWAACKPYVRKLHARNSIILLGTTLDTPVDFVVCWTPEGKVTGGTGQALRIALDYEIPIYNLAVCTSLDIPDINF